MFKGQLRSFCLLASFAIGGSCYQTISSMSQVLPYGIGFMLFITFVGVDFKKTRPQWMHLWIILAIQVIGLGYWALFRAAGNPILAEALFYCGAAPIAAASPVIIHLIKGNVEFSATAMVLSQAAFGILMPLSLPLIVGHAELGYAELMLLVAKQLTTVLAAPALVACILRILYPPCQKWSPKLRDFSLGLWCFNLTIIAACGTERIVDMHADFQTVWPMAAGALLVCATGFIGGYWLGYPKLKRECSQALGQKNTILTLYVAAQGYGAPLACLAPVFYVLFHNIANAIQISLANREQEKRDQVNK